MTNYCPLFIVLFLRVIATSLLLLFGSNALCQIPNPSLRDPRESMRYSTDNSWYDYDSDKLVFPDPSDLSRPAERIAKRHDYVKNKAEPATPLSWDFLNGWIVFLRACFDASWFSKLLLVAGCLGIGVLTFFLLRRLNLVEFQLQKKSKGSASDNTKRDQTRVVDLPFQIHNLQTDLWSEVLRLRGLGDYSNAMVYLYGHSLVELDTASFIELQKGKTNRIYLRELSSKPVLSNIQQRLMSRFEAVFFGLHQLKREEFDESFQLVVELNAGIAQEKETRPTSKQNPTTKEISSLSGVSALTGWWIISLCISATSTVGCGRSSIVSDQLYGEAASYGAKSSVASLSSFRSLCEANGHTSIQLNGLSLRSRQFDVIVLSPKEIRTLTAEEVLWFKDWLTEYPNRTLLFIGRDFSPASRYWQSAMRTEDKIGRAVFAQEKAVAETRHEALRWVPNLTDGCEWFDCIHGPFEITDGTELTGVWAKDMASENVSIPIRGYFIPTGSHASNERQTVDKKDEASENVVDNVLLASKSGLPILFSMKSDYWDGGNVFVVANGAMLTNEGMTYRGHRQFAQRIIEEFPSKGRIGFLSPIQETPMRSDSAQQEASGLELLRVWPLSLISIQALLAGFIVLLALFPIFGRSQQLPQESRSDFGLHIEALGQLLQKSEDKTYALLQIASYFREVRREPNSPWSRIAPPLKESRDARPVSGNE